MGFAGTGAAAILLIGAMYAGAAVAAGNAQASAMLDEARAEWGESSHRAAATAMAITSVSESAGTLTVVVENEGSTTLDASGVRVIVDNVATDADSWDVDGKPSRVWPPQSTLTIELSGSSPDSVVVATADGVTAMWRA